MDGPSASALFSRLRAGRLFRERDRATLLALTVLWALLLVLPWAAWLDAVPSIRTGLAVFIFVLPGLALSLLLAGSRLALPSHITTGLSISVFVLGAFGLLGRILLLPFDALKPLFALAGLIPLVLLQLRPQASPKLYKPATLSWASAVLLLIMGVFAVLVYSQRRVMGDDFTYLAYLTNWRHADPLNFKEVVFGSNNLDAVRFWLGMFPMSLAFLADLSGLHGLLLYSFYLPPFLLALALLAGYSLYEDLLGSDRQAATALVVQFALLAVLTAGHGPGTALFYRLCEDKAFAAFVLFPAFMLAIRCLLDLPGLRTALLAALVGFSLALTHPIMLAYCLFIAGLFGLWLAVRARDFRKALLIVGVCAVVVSPAALLRVVGLPWVSRNLLGLEKTLQQPGIYDMETAIRRGRDVEVILSYIEDTPYYAFNPTVVQMPLPAGSEGALPRVLSWAFLWIMGLGAAWALFHLRDHDAAPFILAASLLLALAAIPYTGWLLGRLVSARMLWRVPWMMPAGLAAAVLLGELPKIPALRRLSAPRAESVILGVSVLACALLVGFYFSGMYKARWPAVAQRGQYLNSLVIESTIGNYLEAHLDKPAFFVAAPPLRDFIPGLSSKSKSVYFRDDFVRRKVDPRQLKMLYSLDQPVSFQRRMRILKRYHIRYILTTNPDVVRYYQGRPEFAPPVEIGGFWIIESLQTGR